MKNGVQDRSGVYGWALSASFALHLAVAAVLLFDLPISLPEPAEDEAIQAELVPPPEPAAPAKAEPPPPPPPQQAEKPAEEAAKPPAPAEKAADPPAALPALQPVVKFGEKDAGPKQSLDGSSAEDNSAEPQSQPEATGPAEQQADTPAKPVEQPAPPELVETSEPKPVETAEAEIADTSEPKPAGAPESQSAEVGAEALDILRDPRQAAAAQAVAPAAEASDQELALPATAERPEPRPEPTAAAQSGAQLRGGGKLFSEQATGEPVATTAKGELPRGVRAGRLCVTALREQLRTSVPPYFPDLLPSYPLKEGNVLEVPRAAFRVAGRWFNLSFRCEVDADATSVTAFAFRVGDPVPLSEWAQRGLPAQ